MAAPGAYSLWVTGSQLLKGESQSVLEEEPTATEVEMHAG